MKAPPLTGVDGLWDGKNGQEINPSTFTDFSISVFIKLCSKSTWYIPFFWLS